MNFLKKIYIHIYGYFNNLIIWIFGLFRSEIKTFWFDDANNFGDILTPYIFKSFGQLKIKKIDPKYYLFTNYLTIGSILTLSNKKSIIWGSGFISANSVFKYGKPAKILAVRGPKTRKRILELGVDCPEVYGDPALLLPNFYKPKTTIKKYKLGIIPHYKDKISSFLENFNEDEVLIIDIQNPNIFEFIDLINQCEKIVSSSLHGLIVADAYQIPSLWIQFSNEIIGDGFKFLDYFESVNRRDTKPVIIDKSINAKDLLTCFKEYRIKIDLNKLAESCPFKNKELEKFISSF
ncbi:polysaccharide pyruvyl transferase family protein [Cellulophaga sp. F20128]|uniref:polysaccharide pyruvyl transferase family protein n=1 Tax=Cellulophaga sp. F20128 TaxID=2926413 RepID=UPI001FF6EE53|nr:polysaccharide pyruvyl transferase family protein [Cellulophaga sp. F20128]MCK0156846.1 polysaccharide pyruvyl transferase family protein [Cellulophaga sp. F20128]